MKKLIKISVLLVFFLLFTLIIWGLGEGPHKNDMLIKYLVFASQLLYGSMCYDILKSLRTVPADNRFWGFAIKTLGEAVTLLVIAIGLLVFAINVPVFAEVGLIGALIAYIQAIRSDEKKPRRAGNIHC